MAQRFEYLSAQFDPASIRRVAAEIDRQKTAKRDYVLPTSRLAFDDAGRLMIQGKTFTVGGRTFLEWSDAEAESDRVRQAVLSSDTQDPAEVADAIANAGKITVSNESGSIELKPTALSQLFGRLEIPKRFADKLTANGNGDLLASLTTGLLGRDSRRLMLRCLDGRVRAVVSDRYRRLDNDDLFYAAASRFRDTARRCGRRGSPMTASKCSALPIISPAKFGSTVPSIPATAGSRVGPAVRATFRTPPFGSSTARRVAAA